MRVARQDADLVVYPACRLLPAYPPLSNVLLTTHSRDVVNQSRSGEAAEFMHTREYRDGDHPRHMHWASWARLGTPTVKVYEGADAACVALVLDTSAPSPTADSTFESAVSVIAGVGVDLVQQGYAIEMLVAGEHLYRLHAHRPEASIGPLLELLAGVRPNGQIDWTSMALALLSERARLSAVVCLALDWSSASAGFVEHLEQHGIGVRTIIVRHGPTSRPAPARPLSLYQHLLPDSEPLAAGNPYAL
jgi:uncharacterized protein (DUF58 family)